MRKVLCPIDFSENSLEAASFAVRFSQLTDCEIKFFHVSSVVVPVGGMDVEMPLRQLQLRQEELENIVNHLYEKLGVVRHPQKSLCETLDYVSIVHGIGEEAEKYHADLIIIGTTGTSGLKRLLIGSVTSSVLDEVSCPVLAIPADFGSKEIKCIAIATNFVHTQEEIQEAVDFARLFNAEIDMFRVDESTSNENNEDVVGSLNEYVTNKKPEILVMFHTQRNWLSSLIVGSKTKEMIFHSEAAILSFNRAKRGDEAV